jgi:hypothetical protein
MNTLGLSVSVRIELIACYRKYFLLQYIQVCQYMLCKADHAYLTYLMLQRQLSHLNGRKLTTDKFMPVIFSVSRNQIRSHVTTDGQSAPLTWNKAHIWGLRSDLCYCQTVCRLPDVGTLSDERTGPSLPRVTVSSNKSVVSMYNLHFTWY